MMVLHSSKLLHRGIVDEAETDDYSAYSDSYLARRGIYAMLDAFRDSGVREWAH